LRVFHFWFLAVLPWAKVGEGVAAAHIESIMSMTISGPDPGPMVIFLTVSYTTRKSLQGSHQRLPQMPLLAQFEKQANSESQGIYRTSTPDGSDLKVSM
jgi:hypothetical protein